MCIERDWGRMPLLLIYLPIHERDVAAQLREIRKVYIPAYYQPIGSAAKNF